MFVFKDGHVDNELSRRDAELAFPSRWQLQRVLSSRLYLPAGVSGMG